MTPRLRPETQALTWHLVDLALALTGVLGHLWLRRQYVKTRGRDWANGRGGR